MFKPSSFASRTTERSHRAEPGRRLLSLGVREEWVQLGRSGERTVAKAEVLMDRDSKEVFYRRPGQPHLLVPAGPKDTRRDEQHYLGVVEGRPELTHAASPEGEVRPAYPPADF